MLSSIATWRRGGKGVAALLFFFVFQAFPLPAQKLGKDYVIRVSEIDPDVVVFEVFLPESQAGRKNVLHAVTDSFGGNVAAEKFSTGDGHYKIAMAASYAAGREYVFAVDGKFKFSFVYQERVKVANSNQPR